jgi:hypothetical protein
MHISRQKSITSRSIKNTGALIVILPLAHISRFREKDIIERKAKNVAFIEGT